MKEIWKRIYINNQMSDYEISNQGRVKSYKRNKETIMKNCINADGYHFVNLRHNKKCCPRLVHRLVAEYFLNEFDKAKTVNHIDCDKNNNNVDNFEILSIEDNLYHALQSENCNITKRNYTEEDIKNIRLDKRNNQKIADDYNTNRAHIYFIKSRKLYKWVK